jgi:alginate O-acetyltransferase complex protein AlgF
MRSIHVIFLAMAAATVPVHAQQAGGGLAGLYAAQPPAGSAFVRVVNTGAAVQLSWEGATTVALPIAGSLATAYRVVDPAHPPKIMVNGKTIMPAQWPAPASFSTWALTPSGDGVAVIVDEPAAANALKVALRVVNLVPGCALSLKTSTGAVVFAAVRPDESQVRNINPVKATVLAQCGTAVSDPLVISGLQAGSRYSVFAHGDAQAPRLSGQIDTTEAYSGKP